MEIHDEGTCAWINFNGSSYYLGLAIGGLLPDIPVLLVLSINSEA
jgi:hypothetical protein